MYSLLFFDKLGLFGKLSLVSIKNTGCFKMNVGVLTLYNIYYTKLTAINDTSNLRANQTVLQKPY
jgi:hypothetical protein